MELVLTIFRVELLLLIAFSSASISFTITTTSIFKGIRKRVSDIHPKMEELIHCPWCLNHYIVFATLVVSDAGDLPLTDYSSLNFIFTFFVITCVSGLIHHILLRAYRPVAEAAAIREIQKLNDV